MRYAGVTISGALAGMGGFVYALTTANCTSNGDVAGLWLPCPGGHDLRQLEAADRGRRGVAVRPVQVCGCQLRQYRITSMVRTRRCSSLRSWALSTHFYRLLPYLITLIVLAFTSKKFPGPQGGGHPLRQEHQVIF